jgi:isochorismate pyruvate lyase
MMTAMSEVSAQDRQELRELRAAIDALDVEIVRLLAKRLALIDRVIAVKRAHGVPARIPERVEEVVAKVRRAAAAAAVPADLAETIWRAMMEWVIAYEKERLGADADKKKR